MNPRVRINPPPVNKQTKPVLYAIGCALNDVDRAVIGPPFDDLEDRFDDIVHAYRAVEHRFSSQCATLGLTDYLRVQVLHRAFGLGAGFLPVADLLGIFNRIKSVGFTSIDEFLGMHLVVARRLLDAGRASDALDLLDTFERGCRTYLSEKSKRLDRQVYRDIAKLKQECRGEKG